MSFVHLHVHSEYSILDGTIRLSDILYAAKRNKMPAVALTDYNMYGAFEFYHEATVAPYFEGLKPIVGCEFNILESIPDGPPNGQSFSHLLLLVKNNEGYKNLLKITTEANKYSFNNGLELPCLTLPALAPFSDGLIAASGCLEGEVPQLLLQGEHGKAKSAVLTYQDIFGKENYYLEIMDHQIPAQKQINPSLVQLGKELGIPLVATNNVHYLNKEDFSAYDILQCTKKKRSLEELRRSRTFTREQYFKSSEAMQQIFAELPQAITNTMVIAEACNLNLDLLGVHLPVFPTPDNLTQEAYLKKLCWAGLKIRYPEGAPQEVIARLNQELRVIHNFEVACFFLIAWDISNYLKPSRVDYRCFLSSIHSSMVAYLLGITEIDPLKYGLLFEHLLNTAGWMYPEFDITLNGQRKGELIEYLNHRFGHQNIAAFLDFYSRDARQALNEIVKVLAKDEKMMLDTPIVPHEIQESGTSNFKTFEIMETAEKIVGLQAKTSINDSCFVIAPEPMVNYAPLQGIEGIEQISQYDSGSLSLLGLMKLNLKESLEQTFIEDVLALIKKNHNLEVVINTIPLNDFEALNMLKGCHKFDLRFFDNMRRLRPDLGDLNAGGFPELLRITALSNVHKFKLWIIEYYLRSHDRKKITYLHPLLKPILKETLGVILYQEQIMLITQTLAGYSAAKAFSLFHKLSSLEQEYPVKDRQWFARGCKKKGVNQETAFQIFDLIRERAPDAVSKSETVAAALLIYQIAYLKAHYPDEFLQALLKNFVFSNKVRRDDQS